MEEELANSSNIYPVRGVCVRDGPGGGARERERSPRGSPAARRPSPPRAVRPASPRFENKYVAKFEEVPRRARIWLIDLCVTQL